MREVEKGCAQPLEINFTDSFTKLPYDPGTITFTLYDSEYHKITEAPFGAGDRVQAGLYRYHYTPDTEGEFIREIKAETNGIVKLDRELIKVVFCKG